LIQNKAASERIQEQAGRLVDLQTRVD
jgi:DNA repair exonuclease SbcCD ATPase subunit